AARREQRGRLGAQPWHRPEGVPRPLSGRCGGRDPPGRLQRGSGAPRGPVDRLAFDGGVARGLGALRTPGRAHRSAADARGARCARAGVRGAAGRARSRRGLHGRCVAGRPPAGQGGGMSPLAPSSSGSGTLAGFQREFARALLDPGAGRGGIGLTPGFAVHRNTVLSGCIDALAANYPVVAALVGREWFRDAAAAYARESPPVDARLMRYGADFHAFLGRLPVVEALPFLPGVALLERLWRESHMAADAPTLDGEHLRGVPAELLARLCPRPHPAARWRWFDDGPVFGVWQAHQIEDEAQCRAALEAVAWRA